MFEKAISINMNRKLSPGKIAVFNLPAGTPVCKMDCPGCYAKKAQRRINVLKRRIENLILSRQEWFSEFMIGLIQKYKHKFSALRIHESGDFYNQEYIDKWEKIARSFPDVKFYTYTKRLRDFDFSRLMSLKNVVVIDSLKEGLNYGDEKEVKRQVAKGLFECPFNLKKGISCNHGCNYCLTKQAQKTGVVFHKH